MQSADPVGRIKSLDGLRAFAVLFVFLFHALPDLFVGGFVGVDLFFVLSGFVITQSLVAEGIHFKQFYLRRFFRIIPPVIPVLLFAAAAGAFGFGIASIFDILAAGASFLNWARAFGFTTGASLGHFWSLSIEEQFYLLWPICLLGLLRRPKSIIPILVAAITALTCWQIGLFLETENFVRVYNGLDTRASQLLLGCLLAFLPRKSPQWIWPAGPAIFIVALFTLPATEGIYPSFGIILAGLASMLMISNCAWARTPVHPLLESRIVQWGGTRSYALYLWHFPIFGLLHRLDPNRELPTLSVVIVAFLLTCIAAEVSWRYIEKPARVMRQRIETRWLHREEIQATV